MTKPMAEFYSLWWTLQRSGHAGLHWPEPVLEFSFHDSRAWRFDAAWPDAMVAVEVDGAVFAAGGGRHNRGAGMAADNDKLNQAVFYGWAVIRLTDKQLKPKPIRYTSRGKQKAGSGSNPVDLLEQIAKLIAIRTRILDAGGNVSVGLHPPRITSPDVIRSEVPRLPPGGPPFPLR